MKFNAAAFYLAFVTAIFLSAVTVGQAQSLPVGHATDFTTESYFEPPHEQQVKMKLSGAEALPLPGGLLDVKRLQIETFAVDGKPEMVVRAPQCTYAPLDGGTAYSSGHLDLQTADGRFHVGGEGFLWRPGDNVLTISNQVHTVIKSGIFKLPT
jgi:hypothetical protein